MIFRNLGYCLAAFISISFVSIEAADPPDKDATYVIRRMGDESARRLDFYQGLACDPVGNLFVSNFKEQQTIGKITPDGNREAFVSLSGKQRPGTLFFDGKDQLFVIDYGTHQILRIDMKTKKVSVKFADPRLKAPVGVTIGSNGILYVSDNQGSNATQGAGIIWKVDAKGKGTIVASNPGTVGGIEISADGKTLYSCEPQIHCVFAYTIKEDGSLKDRHVLAGLGDGGPFALMLDIDGNLYVTSRDPPILAKITSEGKIIKRIESAKHPPNGICFGGPDGCTVYLLDYAGGVAELRVDRPGLAWSRAHAKKD